MPPLSFGEKFEDAYDVVLISNDREQFANHSSQSRRMIENICSQFKIQIEIRRLPVGDRMWIARHKHLDNEYVLDFIVVRKIINDLWFSIRNNHYKDQKLKLLRCGLKRMIYLVEGDLNSFVVLYFDLCHFSLFFLFSCSDTMLTYSLSR